MNADSCHVQYGEHVIEFTVIRSGRKTLEIAVEPDTSVVVTAPMDGSRHAATPGNE